MPLALTNFQKAKLTWGTRDVRHMTMLQKGRARKTIVIPVNNLITGGAQSTQRPDA